MGSFEGATRKGSAFTHLIRDAPEKINQQDSGQGKIRHHGRAFWSRSGFVPDMLDARQAKKDKPSQGQRGYPFHKIKTCHGGYTDRHIAHAEFYDDLLRGRVVNLKD